MEFDFDDDQYAFADSVRALLEREFPAAALRGLWEADAPDVREIWGRLAESGILAVAAGEEYGGGGSLIDLTLVFGQLGAFGVPESFALAAGVVVPVLAATGQGAQWLVGISEGRLLPALVQGGRRVVVGAQDADVFVFVDDDELIVAPRSAVQVRPLTTQDPTLRAGEVTLVGDGKRIDAAGVGLYASQAVQAVLASTMVGGAQRQVELTRDYLLVREQFDKVIGSFQALKHRLADAVVRVETARSLAWWAGYVLVREPAESPVASAMAKDAANVMSVVVGAAALQLHGGIGFTWEHDLHLWVQRAAALRVVGGQSDDLRLELGDRFIADVVGTR